MRSLARLHLAVMYADLTVLAGLALEVAPPG